jgi:hypothetical protein
MASVLACKFLKSLGREEGGKRSVNVILRAGNNLVNVRECLARPAQDDDVRNLHVREESALDWNITTYHFYER